MRWLNICTLGLILIIFFGCDNNSIGQSSSIATSRISFNQTTATANRPLSSSNVKNVFNVGGSYDSMSSHPTNTTSCLSAASDISNIQLNNQQTLLSFSSVSDSNSVQNALGVEFSATIGWGAFATTIAYDYARSSEDDDYSLNLNYIYQYTGKASFNSTLQLQGNSVLTPAALNLVQTDPISFRTMCGDGFVNELNAGASVLMRVKLKFNSYNEKTVFDNSFNQAGGLQDVLSIIQSNGSGIHYSLSVAGMQVGGNPQLLNTLFESYGGQIGANGYPVLECGTDTSVSPDCTNIINQVIPYANTISAQLNTINDYYLDNPSVAKWQEIGVFPGSTNVESMTLQAMADLSSQYDIDQTDLDFLNNYHYMLSAANLLSSDMNNNLTTLISKYDQVIAVYHNPENNIMNCYNGYVSSQCIQIRDSILQQRSMILNDQNLNNLLIYLKNSQYQAYLLKQTGIDAFGNQALCSLNPISDSNLKLFLINCDGQVSGTLDNVNAFTINYDELKHLLHINNLNYNYQQADGSLLNISYYLNQELAAQASYQNTWSGTATVVVDGGTFGSDTLTMVSVPLK